MPFGAELESDSEEVSYLLLVDYDFHSQVHDHLDWAPPARMKVGKGLYGPRTAALREASSCGTCWAPESGGCTRFACSPFMAGFMELKHSERRQLKTAGSAVAKKVVKLTQNAIFGRCMNPEVQEHERHVDPAKFKRACGQEL